MIKNIDEYIKEGILKKINPDKERARSLIEESERKFRVLNRQIKVLGIDDELANEYILLCYDSLMFLIRAKIILDGYYASGFKAHEAEVSYLGELNISEKDIQFADKLRFFRNGMLYYGTTLDKEYAEKVIAWTKSLRAKLIKLINID